MAPADVLVASPVNGMVGLEMCSATPPDACKSPHTPRLLQRAGIRALEQIAADETDTQQAEAGAETLATSPTVKTSPTAAKRKRQSLSPTTSAGTLDSEGPETSPDELEDSQPSQPLPEENEVNLPTPIKRFVVKNKDRKRRKVDVIENALKKFHEEETKAPRCFEYTTICHPKYRNRNRRREAAKMRVQVGVSLAQGARPYMEDRYSVVERLLDDEEDAESSPSLLAVYDGHNGAYASEYARRRFKDLLGESEDLVEISRRAQHTELTDNDVEKIRELLVDAFATVDAEILQRTVILNKRDGSTVLLGLLVGGKLFVANLGDSRGVLAQTDESSEGSDGEDDEEVPSAVRLSVDHKPDLKEETERVEEAGGKVIFSGCWRVAHDQIPLRLAISRSLGDHPLKLNLPESCSAPLVSVIPDVRVLNVEAAGEFLVLASDGLWDRLSDDDAAKIVRAKVTEFQWSEEPTNSEDVTKEALQFAANALVEAALLKRSMDNITAMVISFSELSDEENTNA
ncbi:Protein phosphatase 2C [Phytophthora palmivora]|uniref:Protein phosphatase 2C n=1 Tax=Phytophthora palmivora TaxID=4796 RepID=A0A2P4Y618_9STRA|nr:Protein phosphatase 2C [Phytophthora palmivora]